MIVTLTNESTIESVEKFLARFDLQVHRVVSHRGMHVATSGDEREVPFAELRQLDGVVDVIEVPPPYYFASRDFHDSASTVQIGGVPIGFGAPPVVVAGPCAVENRTDTLDTAVAVKAAGAQIFRGGIFKPRTTPYNFQGIGRRGLEILAAVRDEVGLPVVTEVLDPADIGAVAEVCDAIQVGTRNMTNSALLKRLGSAGRPIVLKRGFATPIEELVRAAEFIIVNGNPDVILCERGIQTFERATRYTLDLSAVPALKEVCHLPVIVDPSHSTGRPSLIDAMSRAAVVVGADGLLIECHVRPENMIKPGDDFQAVRPSQLAGLVASIPALHSVITQFPTTAE
ncbi:3-deoxy-7-phosphoheptulonate synthase [Rhodococcus sp. T7]|uniref:3-deoxy-7-phosphoheptulonate synthase n=1 Tax=Rhodococcus sp. T7 TaxID=627444 RepID=UPI00135B78FD|nr:3-deoxy-7-phosphoheptulonate synthase [Rhodococcus sp. T7]KAF0957331.1 Phospho-2-dehydro-3-deoxyheptonate aldolase [Rhodococcus sp. T7]KAF0959176.1 Phospho-2-dehydro-3-deoxyheptonate aldolase [Rhodococcus sp. T7]